MQAVIRSIASNPAIVHKLQRAIDETVHLHDISARKTISDTTLRNLPYLQACISEGVRMYPAITQLRERVVPPEGDNLHGMYVPGGTFVALNGQSSQSDPIYGSDLETYQPERWMTDDTVLLAKMQRDLDLNFGYGTSKCLGTNVAQTEMNKIIFEVSLALYASGAESDK
jgi:cytochrome P450